MTSMTDHLLKLTDHRDRDLLELPYGLGVEILSPAQALEQWRLG